jgi:hypothetical protein
LRNPPLLANKIMPCCSLTMASMTLSVVQLMELRLRSQRDARLIAAIDRCLIAASRARTTDGRDDGAEAFARLALLMETRKKQER